MLEEILHDHPRFPGVQFNLGVLYEEQGKPDEGAGRRTPPKSRTIRTASRHASISGKLLARDGDWQGSSDQMREVMQDRSQDGRRAISFWRGTFSTSQRRSKKSRRCAERGSRSRRRRTSKAFGWFLMADVFNRRHQPDKVTSCLAERQDAG